jgi:hypothetical protein
MIVRDLDIRFEAFLFLVVVVERGRRELDICLGRFDRESKTEPSYNIPPYYVARTHSVTRKIIGT